MEDCRNGSQSAWNAGRRQMQMKSVAALKLAGIAKGPIRSARNVNDEEVHTRNITPGLLCIGPDISA